MALLTKCSRTREHALKRDHIKRVSPPAIYLQIQHFRLRTVTDQHGGSTCTTSKRGRAREPDISGASPETLPELSNREHDRDPTPERTTVLAVGSQGEQGTGGFPSPQPARPRWSLRKAS